MRPLMGTCLVPSTLGTERIMTSTGVYLFFQIVCASFLFTFTIISLYDSIKTEPETSYRVYESFPYMLLAHLFVYHSFLLTVDDRFVHEIISLIVVFEHGF